MAKTGRMVYVCCVCHRVGLRPLRCHPGKSNKCDAGMPGDERSMPLVDEHGHLVTRAQVVGGRVLSCKIKSAN